MPRDAWVRSTKRTLQAGGRRFEPCTAHEKEAVDGDGRLALKRLFDAGRELPEVFLPLLRRLEERPHSDAQPGQTRPVSFTLDASDFGFYDNSGKFVVEPGEIEVYAGDSSTATLEQSFTVTG
jgi:hypothetical protein